MSIYCTYLTVYLGSKLPMFYIGSSSVAKVNKGYHGSVSSKIYKPIWDKELKENPHLFKTKIITTHETREAAILNELKFQKHLNVIKSSLYINLSFATGKFGLENKGENNPMFGVKHTDRAKLLIVENRISTIMSEETKIKLRKPKNNTDRMKKPKTIEHALNISKGKKGKPKSESDKENLKRIVVCQHCGISGGLGGMSRHHFNNCKLKPVSLIPL